VCWATSAFVIIFFLFEERELAGVYFACTVLSWVDAVEITVDVLLVGGRRVVVDLVVEMLSVLMLRFGV